MLYPEFEMNSHAINIRNRITYTCELSLIRWYNAIQKDLADDAEWFSKNDLSRKIIENEAHMISEELKKRKAT